MKISTQLFEHFDVIFGPRHPGDVDGSLGPSGGGNMQVHARLKQCAYSHCQAVTDRPVEMSFVACACSFDVTTPEFGVG